MYSDTIFIFILTHFNIVIVIDIFEPVLFHGVLLSHTLH